MFNQCFFLREISCLDKDRMKGLSPTPLGLSNVIVKMVVIKLVIVFYKLRINILIY